MSEEQKPTDSSTFTPSFQPDTDSTNPERATTEFRYAVREQLHEPDPSLRQQLEPHQVVDMTPNDALYDGPGGTLYGVVELGLPENGGVRGVVMREGGSDEVGLVINGSRVILTPGGEPVMVGRTPDSPFEFGQKGQTAVSRAHMTIQLDADGRTVRVTNLEPTYGTGLYLSPKLEEAEPTAEETPQAEEPEQSTPEVPEWKEVDIAAVLTDPGQIRQVLRDEQVDPAIREQLHNLVVAWRDLDAMRRVNEAWQGKVAEQMAAVKEKASQLDAPLVHLQSDYDAARQQLQQLAGLLTETNRSYLAEALPVARANLRVTIESVMQSTVRAQSAAEELSTLLPAQDQLSEEVISSLRVAGRAMTTRELETDDDMFRRMSQDPIARGGDLAAVTAAVKGETNRLPDHHNWHARLTVMRQTMLEGFAVDRYGSQLITKAAQFKDWYDELDQQLQRALTQGGNFDPGQFTDHPYIPQEEIARVRSLLQAIMQS